MYMYVYVYVCTYYEYVNHMHAVQTTKTSARRANVPKDLVIF